MELINIYLDKLRVLQEEGDEYSVEEIKKGIDILYSRLK